MNTFKDMLKYLRERENITQAQLAKGLGLSRSTVGMYETGEREPDFETLEAIADYFNVDMNFLLGKAELIENQKENTPAPGEGLSEFESKYSVLSDESKAMVRERIQTLFEKENPPKT